MRRISSPRLSGASKLTHVFDLTSPPEVGDVYLVDCVKIAQEWIPILGPMHDDLVLGITNWHFHLDHRFMTDDQIKTHGRFYLPPAKIVRSRDPQPPPPTNIKTESFVCLRKEQQIGVFLTLLDLYDSYKNNRCPHKGTYLGNCEVRNGCIQCPMHGLKFKKDTGILSNKLKFKTNGLKFKRDNEDSCD